MLTVPPAKPAKSGAVAGRGAVAGVVVLLIEGIAMPSVYVERDEGCFFTMVGSSRVVACRRREAEK